MIIKWLPYLSNAARLASILLQLTVAVVYSTGLSTQTQCAAKSVSILLYPHSLSPTATANWPNPLQVTDPVVLWSPHVILLRHVRYIPREISTIMIIEIGNCDIHAVVMPCS